MFANKRGMKITTEMACWCIMIHIWYTPYSHSSTSATEDWKAKAQPKIATEIPIERSVSRLTSCYIPYITECHGIQIPKNRPRIKNRTQQHKRKACFPLCQKETKRCLEYEINFCYYNAYARRIESIVALAPIIFSIYS